MPKIFYYQRRDRQPNFGDELNTWLWPKLLPNTFNQDDTTLFVGTGTLLNSLLPERTRTAQKVIIFSSGAGYEHPLKKIPDHWQILCVRGPLSARRLKLPAEKAITDGGILISRCFQPTCKQTTPYSFIPHIHHANFAQPEWEQLCAEAGIRYIDPRWPVEQVLQAIGETQVLLAEAMHGAIVADALRIPWIPIVTSPRILAFKWQDWCASMALPYCPQVLPPLLEFYPRYAQGIRSSIQSTAYWFKATRIFNHLQYSPTSPLPHISTSHHQNTFISTENHRNPLSSILTRNHDTVVSALRQITRQENFFLSKTSLLEQQIQRLENKLMACRRQKMV